jgi:linoleoyl-CoA desaturase
MNLRNAFIKKESAKALYERIFSDVLKGQNLKASASDLTWYALVLSGWILSYVFGLNSSSFMEAAGFGLLLGFFSATSGLSCAHEMMHKAAFKSPLLTHLSGLIFGDIMVGVSAANWKNSHNIYHHNNTNVRGDDQWMDPDLVDVYNLRKLFKGRKLLLYCALPFLFFLTMVLWTIFSDLKVLTTRHHDKNSALKYHYGTGEYALAWVAKLLYFATLVPPFVVMPLGFAAIFLSVSFLVKGLYFGTVFLIAHTQGDVVHFPDFSQVSRKYSWEEIQILGSANFSPRSRIVTRLVGGLNYQIEHHLFPYVAPRLYPRIAPEVRRFAQENQLVYVEYRTLAQGFQAVVRFLTA